MTACAKSPPKKIGDNETGLDFFLSRYYIFIALLALCLTSCHFSVKPIYSDQEQAIAERAVAEFHRLHNEVKFKQIHELMDDRVRQSEPEAKTLDTLRQTFEKFGKVQQANLIEAKVFPSTVPG